jgi:hypothetical protein
MPEEIKKEEEKNPKEMELEKNLQVLKTEVDTAKRFQSEILNDPDIVALLTAKRDGKKMTISPAEEIKPRTVKEITRRPIAKDTSEDDYENLSKKDLINIIADAVDEAMDSKIKNFEDVKSKELTNRFGQLEDGMTKMQKAMIMQAAKTGVENARAAHSDFGSYEEKISQILDELPNISLERAYKLAKAETVEKVPPINKVESERPVNIGVRPRRESTPISQSEHKENLGVRGFRDLMSKGLDKALARKRDSEYYNEEGDE